MPFGYPNKEAHETVLFVFLDLGSRSPLEREFFTGQYRSGDCGRDLSGFASLLLETRGSVVMAAAKVGEKAEGGWETGGVFTERIVAISEEIGKRQKSDLGCSISRGFYPYYE